MVLVALVPLADHLAAAVVVVEEGEEGLADMQFFMVGLLLASLVIFFKAISKTQKGQFYQDTLFLSWLGIYVWGDALVLGVFWFLASLLWLVFKFNFTKLVVVFFTARAFFEVIYWLNAQAVKKDYIPPLLRKFKQLNSDQAAILYQLLNFIALVFGLSWLWDVF